MQQRTFTTGRLPRPGRIVMRGAVKLPVCNQATHEQRRKANQLLTSYICCMLLTGSGQAWQATSYIS
jgi:hypothetical protein